MGGAVIYIVWLVALFGTAMGLFFGLRAVKLI
ncbi:MAG: cytochrome b6-f complex subunit PetL [Cyanobacteria bacterium P01_D01_bin.105]